MFKKLVKYVLTGITVFIAASLNAYAQATPGDYAPEAQVLNYQPQRFGDYEVHYSAFNSTFIPPVVAEASSLKRDGRYAVVNIAIRNIKDSASGKAAKGLVTGRSMNLLSQEKRLAFREVNEGNAVYYLAGFQFSGEERLKFSVDIKPEGSNRTETIRFEQTFYEEK